MKRTPRKLEYIENLVEDKNLEGLEQEKECLDREVQYYRNEVMTTLDSHKNFIKYTKQLENELVVLEIVKQNILELINEQGKK